MAVYVLIFAIILAGIIWHDFREKSNDRVWKIILIATGLILALIAGLRYHNGLDTFAYNIEYEHAVSHDWLVKVRAGVFTPERFDWLHRAAFAMGMGVWAVQLLCSLILNGIFTWFTLRNTRNWFLAFFFYFVFAYFNLNFEVMREGAAAGIALWAWGNYHRGEYWKYYLKLIIGLYFHYSILVMFLLPLMHLPALRRIVMDWKGVVIFIAGGFAAGFLARLMVETWLPGLVEMMPSNPWKGPMSFKLKVYLAHGVNAMSLNWKGFIGYLTGYVGYSVVIWYFLRLKIGKGGACGEGYGDDEKLDIDFGGMLLLMAAAVMASFNFETMGRLQNYLILACAVGFSRSVYNPNRTLWALVMTPMVLFKIYTYASPVKFIGRGRVYELYLPYNDWIRKNADEYQDSLVNLYHEKAQTIYPRDTQRTSE